MPDDRKVGPLLERASTLTDVALRLGSEVGPLAGTLRSVLRAMNSYYTNRIEGQHTRPADIERALRHDFDADLVMARKQRIAVAHIEAEAELELSETPVYSPAAVSEIHAALHRRLRADDRLSDTGEEVVPGVLRTVRVAAGDHLAPDPAEVPALLGAWSDRYAALAGRELRIVGAACAHHRLLWIHPFLDGNGRTARLHTHLALHRLGLTHGLWSPLRGIARDVETYYARLHNADLPRRNDLDGRGNLSEEELVAFAAWLLDVCIDQARFMRELLGLGALRDRIADLLRHLSANPWQIGSERSVVHLDATAALHYVAIAGPIDRTRFTAMTGLPPRTARRVLATLIDFGVLRSDSARGPVAFATPLSSLRFLLPRLWPEAESPTR